MASFTELLSDLELVLMDLKVDSMIADLLEHSAESKNYDLPTREIARSRTISFIGDHVKDLDMAFYHLDEYHSEHKKIAFASVQLGGTSDETAISSGILQSDSERSIL